MDVFGQSGRPCRGAHRLRGSGGFIRCEQGRTRTTQIGRIYADSFVQKANRSSKCQAFNKTMDGGLAMSEFQKATLAGGCFWCQEAVFDELKGVVSVESG